MADDDLRQHVGNDPAFLVVSDRIADAEGVVSAAHRAAMRFEEQTGVRATLLRAHPDTLLCLPAWFYREFGDLSVGRLTELEGMRVEWDTEMSLGIVTVERDG